MMLNWKSFEKMIVISKDLLELSVFDYFSVIYEFVHGSFDI